MNIEEMDTLTAIQWLRGGHYEEVITFLIGELKQQKKRIDELEKVQKREESDMR